MEQVTEYDVSTGQVTVRDVNAEELEMRKMINADYKKHSDDLKAKADARISALAKLADLGLTQDEINAL